MKILIVSPMHSEAVARLRTEHDVTYELHCSPDRLKTLLADCEVLVFRSGVTLSRDVLSAAPRLGLVIRAGCGIDNLDLAYMAEHNIQFHRIPQPAALAVAELTVGLMIALARNLRTAHNEWEKGHWIKEQLEGRLLHGKTLGVVGLGNIGSRVAETGKALGMRPIGCVAKPDRSRMLAFEQQGIQLTFLEDVLSDADFVTIHVPLSDSTKKLIGADQLARMRPGAILLNLARGGVVDELALRDALVHKHLAGAALDVHQQEGDGKISPLAGMPNVILTPHIGSMTSDTQREIGERVVSIVATYKGQLDVIQQDLLAVPSYV